MSNSGYRLVMVAADVLSGDQLKSVEAFAVDRDCSLESGAWFQASKTYVWRDAAGFQQAEVEALRQVHEACDFALIPNDLPQPKLFLSDMDATMIVGESIDEMAEVLGLGEKISAITAKAMNGEIDFGEALEERVGLLAGLDVSAVEAIAANIRLQPGAMELVGGLKRAGVRCVLVSGGFTHIAEIVAKTLGFDMFHANVLNVSGGKLTGTVQKPYVGKQAKLELLQDQATQLGVDLSACVTIGDGANDIAMLQAAGLGCGFEGKELVRAATPYQINVTDLQTLLAYLDIQN